MTEADLRRRIEELEGKLLESEQTTRALASGEIDTILDASVSTPLLLAAAQEKLRANEELLRAVFDGATDAMLIADEDGRYVDANPAACVMFALPKEELVGRGVAEFTDPAPQSAPSWQTFLADGRMAGEFPLLRLDGTRRTLEFGATANFVPGLHLSILRDVTERNTERKAADAALRASEVRYRRIVDNTSEGVWMYDAAGVTTFMNPRMAAMLDWTVEEVIGQPVFEFTHEDSRQEARARIDRQKRGATERGESRLKRRDGSDLWISMHVNPLFDDAGNFEYALVLATDITHRRQSDEMRDRLAAIVETSEDAIFSRGTDGIIRTWNRGAEKLTQYTAEEAIGQPVEMLWLPESRAPLNAVRALVDAGQVCKNYEIALLRKDGSRVEAAVTSSALRDEKGIVRGASIIARDISERRNAEVALRRSEEQLRQAQKMEAIGILAGGVAHDFNNLLSVILSYTSIILEELRPGDPLHGDLSEVNKAGLRASDLTRQLLAFSRRQILNPEVVDLNEIIAGMENMLRRLLRADVELSILPSPSLGRVLADPGQIEQVIMNLTVNARDAMPLGGRLTLETSNVEINAASASEHTGVSSGRYVLLAITDTGVGMDAATHARIFEPFFTTKAMDKGTGLGLSTVFGIVAQSEGHISAESEIDHGTMFRVYLPRTDEERRAKISELPPPKTVRGSETILLVEDEEQVRVVARTILRRNGYAVIEAQNAGEALLVCEQHPDAIQLLLTDIVMPRMGGRQLAERLVTVRPAMKVLYMSGYTDDSIVQRGVLDSGLAFLHKPFTPDALLRRVRAVLES